MVNMIDCAVGFLGPDMDPLREDLEALGKRHMKYHVQPKDLPTMEKAVVFALEEMMGPKFTRNDRRAWEIVFQFMVKAMITGMENN